MRHDYGIALITVLLVVAMATVVTVSMMSRQQFDIRRTGNMLQAEQAWLYIHGIEGWAGQLLSLDYHQSETDHLGEDWAIVLPPMPVEGGKLSGSIEDMQGRFNINNLLDSHGEVDTRSMLQFQHLLTVLSLDPGLATELVDWLDADIEPRFPGGAEDNTYVALEPAYRAANRHMVNVTEIRLLRGMDTDSYAVLLPHVTALPERTKINVNTAGVPVLQSLVEGLSETEAKQILMERGDKGFENVGKFLQHPVLAGRKVMQEMIGIESHYFGINSQVQAGRIFLEYQTLLQRDDTGRTRIIQRAQGGL